MVIRDSSTLAPACPDSSEHISCTMPGRSGPAAVNTMLLARTGPVGVVEDSESPPDLTAGASARCARDTAHSKQRGQEKGHRSNEVSIDSTIWFPLHFPIPPLHMLFVTDW